MMIVVLSIPAASMHADEAADSAAYRSAIALLNEYLQGKENASVDLASVKAQFDSLGNYQSSKFFSMYAEVLYNLEKGFYMANEEKLQMLGIHIPFSDEVKGLKEEYKSLGSVEELIAYANGRKQAARCSCPSSGRAEARAAHKGSIKARRPTRSFFMNSDPF